MNNDIMKNISELSGNDARHVLKYIFEKLVTDNAGLSGQEFAYVWRSDWLKIVEEIKDKTKGNIC